MPGTKGLNDVVFSKFWRNILYLLSNFLEEYVLFEKLSVVWNDLEYLLIIDKAWIIINLVFSKQIAKWFCIL